MEFTPKSEVVAVTFPEIDLGYNPLPEEVEFEKIYSLGESPEGFFIRVSLPESELEIGLYKHDDYFSLDTTTLKEPYFPILNLSIESKRKVEYIYKHFIQQIANKLGKIDLSVESIGSSYRLGKGDKSYSQKKAVQRSYYRERQLRKLFPTAEINRIDDDTFEMTVTAN